MSRGLNAAVLSAAQRGTTPLPLRQRLRRWLKPPRTLRFLREGKYFVSITIGIGLAAINTGNNLLYLLFGMMLSLIIASGLLSEMSLRGLAVERNPPLHVYAQRPFLMGVTLTNGKLRLPSFSIEVEDLLAERVADKRCYFLKIPAQRSQQTSYRQTFPRRGLVTFSGFRLSTKFPFALFHKSRTIECPGEVIVLPAIHPVTAPLPSPRTPQGEQLEARRGRAGEFHGLRDHRDGDDPRDIHWRSSARRGKPITREYERDVTRRLTLLLDNGVTADERFEAAICMAASLGVYYVEHGYAVRVLTRSGSSPWASTPAQLYPLLRFLALLAAVDRGLSFPAPGEAAGELISIVAGPDQRPIAKTGAAALPAH